MGENFFQYLLYNLLARGLRPLDSRKEHSSLTCLTANPCENFAWIGRKVENFIFFGRGAARCALPRPKSQPARGEAAGGPSGPSGLCPGRCPGTRPGTPVQGVAPLAGVQGRVALRPQHKTYAIFPSIYQYRYF
jgi:hypothetical protein